VPPVFAALLSVVAATAAPPLIRSRDMMGTRVTVALAAGPSSAETDSAFNQAFAVFERIEAVMNEWKPESTLSAINRAAGTGRSVKAPEDLCEVLKLALDGAARTDGLFDPTWAALRDVWRFGAHETPRVPASEQLAALCPLVRYQDVKLSPLPAPEAGCSVTLQKRGMRLGLGGIAKGYGVDLAVRKVRALGFKSFYIQAGGDLYASGRNGARRWRVGIRDPRGAADDYFASLEVEDAAFSTSGDYERFFIQDGQRYHHLLDPRTCKPASKSRSVSILARSAVEAEILGKAAFILGGQQALRWIHKAKATMVGVTQSNEVVVSPELASSLTIHRSPRP